VHLRRNLFGMDINKKGIDLKAILFRLHQSLRRPCMCHQMPHYIA
jgi:hypothetical protein